MVNDFHPDVIIGSVVSSNPGKPQEGDIMGQLENMIMQKTDYSLPDSLGILMTFKYDNVNLMDFDRFDELHDIGYNRTIQLMDSIKARISRRINYRQLELKRIAYKKNMPELRFREISITGGNEQQKEIYSQRVPFIGSRNILFGRLTERLLPSDVGQYDIRNHSACSIQ